MMRIKDDHKILPWLPYFSLKIPTEVLGYAEVAGVITVRKHLIALGSEGLATVFRRLTLLHDPPRLVFILWFNTKHLVRHRVPQWVLTGTTAHTNFDNENWFYPPHINQAVDDDRVCCCDYVQHRKAFWIMCFPTKHKRKEN